MADVIAGSIALELAPPPDPAEEPAIPAGLARIRAFVNTREIDGAAVVEGFATPADLGAWLLAQGLLPQGARMDAGDLDEAIRLREALRELLLGNAGHRADPAAVEHLRSAGRHAPVAVTFDEDGSAMLAPAASGAAAAFGRLLADVAIAVADGSWPRLKACRNDECRWAYYDASRNRSGRWCSMAGCGNRMKGRAYRDRSRSATARGDWTR